MTDRSINLSSDSSGFGDFFRYHGWLSPGVRLFRRLSFTAKALWISAAFVIPLALMLGFLWLGAQDVISATRAEQQGMAYLRPGFELIRAAQERRHAVLNGDAAAAELGRRVDDAFDKLAAVDKTLGAELGTARAFAEVQRRHAALRQDGGAAPDALPAAHNGFVDALLALVADVADGSQLSLDPELDTYHMMVVSILRGPMQTENTARLRSVGTRVLKAGQASAAERDLLNDAAAVQAYVDADVERSYRLGIAAFPEVAGTMDMAGTDAAFDAFMKVVREQVLADDVKGDAAAYQALGGSTVERQNKLNDQVFKRLADRLQQRIDQQNHGLMVKFALAVAFVLLALYLMVSFYRVMMGGLQEVSGHLREITQGNLTTVPRPWGSDEAAELMLTLGEMQAALRRIVGVVLDGSAQVRNSSGEIAGAALDLSGRTEQSAANLEQTAATMEHIAEQVRQTSSTVDGAARIVQDNAGAAGQCGRVISDVVQTMEQIRQSSGRIGEIIGTIDGIAFQTNILALNAAVEAARAGEQGRGFAVVASEVRALAQRSAQAAKEIKTLIGASIEQVESGHAVVGQAREMMAGIVTNAEHMATMMSEITQSTQQQRQGVVEVGQAVHALDETTQQNAALVEQTSAAASGLAEQAERLSAEISFFRLG